MKQFKLKASIASTVATICMTIAPVSQATTIKAAMSAPLRSVDPIVTTAYIVQDFSNLVYETLLSRTKDGEIKHQMVEGWEDSDDGKKYTFTLREGLKWHDGNSVTAADCIASIKRWAEQDSMGKLMMERVESIDEIDDKSFSITMEVETDIALPALSKESTS